MGTTNKRPFSRRVTNIELPGNQVAEREAVVVLAVDQVIQLYQDPEQSVDIRIS